MEKRAIFYIDDEYDRQLLREMVEEQEDDIDELSEDEDDVVEEEKEDTDTEQENDEGTDSDEDQMELSAGMVRLGRDRVTKWRSDKPPESAKAKQHKVVTHLPGARGAAKNAKTAKECWDCFVDGNMISLIVECTNEKITSVQAKYSRERDAKLTNATEIKALIAVLYLCAAKKDNHTNTKDIFATDKMGTELCRLIMPERRFKFLLYCLRFDHKNTRAQRKEVDNLAPIRELLTSFINNCQQSYCIGEFCTIDAKLEYFRGRCQFRQFIPRKAHMYGIKVFFLVDARTYYTHNFEVYVGKQPDGPFQVNNRPQDVVKRLCSEILGSGRNLTTDSWFTSVLLAEELLQNNLTLVGSIRRNKREIPSSFANVRSRMTCSSKFAYKDSCLLVSYVPRKNKNVLLLSTLQHELCDTFEDQTKPEIVQFYNATKSGVEKVDQMCCAYNVARRSSRWPMVLFYTVLNVAGINAQIIFRSNKGDGPPIVRSRFLKNLARELADGALRERALCKSLPRELRQQINEVSPREVKEEVAPEPSTSGRKRQRCYKCGRAKSRYTQYRCAKCSSYICLQHSTKVCPECTLYI